MNATLLRRAAFSAIFLAAFGIYVMRASTSGALREPPETGDGHDYDAIAFNVWQGRGFGYDWSDENWRKPYEGIPRYRLAALGIANEESVGALNPNAFPNPAHAIDEALDRPRLRRLGGHIQLRIHLP